MFDRLRKIIPDLSKAKVIEGIIDPSVHLEYIEYSSKVGKDIVIEEVISKSDDIFSEELSIDDKKKLLVSMAKIDDVNIFRKVQKYAENPDKELSDWSIIALEESRNLIQSSLLGEEQILISTGLGGKGNKLRFFIISQTENNESLSDIKKKIIKKEIEFAFQNNDCELEQIEFADNFYTIVGVFPFDFDVIETTLSSVFDEVKKFDINLSQKYIITNVKISTLEESAEMIREMEQKEKSNDFEKNEFDNNLFDIDEEETFEDLFDEDFDDDDDELDDDDEFDIDDFDDDVF